jgi:two-component system response regulator DevR
MQVELVASHRPDVRREHGRAAGDDPTCCWVAGDESTDWLVGLVHAPEVAAGGADGGTTLGRGGVNRSASGRLMHRRAAEGRNCMETSSVRIFLLDDHEVVRRGVADLLRGEPGFEIVGEASTAAEAIARIPALKPDVAVLDVRLPDGNGVEVCREVRSRVPDLACLMLTSFADDEALFDAIMAGASGYVLKQIRGNDLIHAVRTVAGGESLLDPAATARVLERLRHGEPTDPRLASLTDQERRILELIGEGLTNREIGERMFLAEKTVKNYVSNLLAKMGMERRTQVAAYAAKLDQRGGKV